jgi:serine/threonine protein kinase
MCLDMAGQVASGIAEIHRHDLAHLDIHAGNIFIDGVLAAQACLCHMGPMGWEIGAQEICPRVLGVYSGGVLFGRALHPDFVLA